MNPVFTVEFPIQRHIFWVKIYAYKLIDRGGGGVGCLEPPPPLNL